MALFTHGDDLEEEGVSIETFISENKSLKNFIRQCHGGYHVFNNRMKDKQQVKELLEKIHQMVERNGGSYFTNEMLQRAEKVIREEMERLLKVCVGLRLEAARRQAERTNSFIKNITLGSYTVTGAAAGGSLGPVGAAVGAAVGAGVGYAVNTASELIEKKNNHSCIIQ